MMSASCRPSRLLAIIVAALFIVGCESVLCYTQEKYNESGRIIGIHLGTTYSSVGVHMDSRTKIIANEQGKRKTPSWIAFNNNETLIGEAARDQALVNPKRTVFHVKRLIGRKFDDEEVQRAIKWLPYNVVNVDGKPYIKVVMEDGETKVFSPEEISAMIIVKMKEIAEAFVGMKIDKAVLTVPAYFNDAQRQATRDAGVIAGLNVVEIIDEPIAAAIGYRMQGRTSNILVFDLGGATFDVTILAVDRRNFEVLAATRDQYLGGDDFDYRIMEYFVNLIKKKHGKDISNDNRALDKLRRESERAKTALSKFMQHQVHVEIESLFAGTNFSETLTRVQFEDLSNDLLQKTMSLIKKTMDDAGLQKNQIDDIALVGGSIGIPKLLQLLEDYFDMIDHKQRVNLNVDPDEAVAYGAALRGSILRGDELEDICLWPVIPLSYGIETTGGVMTKLIPSGIPDLTPMTRSRNFTTYQDQQTTVSIKVFRGMSRFTKNCRLLEEFNLSGIPPAPRGSRQIEVTFFLDPDHRLNVTAEDKGSGKAEYRTIYYKGFTPEEVDRMDEKEEEIGDDSNILNQINDIDKLADKL